MQRSAVEAPSLEGSATRSNSDDPSRGRVMLVEDDDLLRRSMERVLRLAGFEVMSAEDGIKAMASLQLAPYDAVVSDIAMPGMDGVELLRTVRQYDPDIPVIMVTGTPALETAMKAVEFGAFRYLPKTAPPDELIRVLDHAIRLHAWAKLRRLSELGHPEMAPGDKAGLDAGLDRALSSLWMAYQPIVAVGERKIYAFEALMRGTEPTLPHPGAVLGAAEKLDRCDDVGRAVRASVSATMNTVTDIVVFVNLHARDLLDPSLYAAESPMSSHARRTVLEITERAALDDVPQLQHRIQSLRKLGFRIAIDDLGAGYAGLTSFAQLEPDIVKIDMSLVRDVETSAIKRKLIRSIVQLGKELGTIVVAEGVETTGERDALIDLGCDLLQGYYFARPARLFPPIQW